jgi:serine/threonine-protein kinase
MPDLLERLKSALGDRYAVESEIGRGGMAVVYLAEDLKHRRQVAIKVLHPELAASLGADRFLREIEIVAGLDHPHILPLHDSGAVDGLLYYVMPYVEGESLRDLLQRETQLPVDEAVRIACEVARALGSAHRHGVVHRDIKPGNVLLSEGHARVADFGIARAVSSAGPNSMTATGLAVGTPSYMSPEQASGEQVDERSDLYALGCVLYKMLSGEPPLVGPTTQSTAAKRLTDRPTPLPVLRDTVSLELDAVVEKSLSRSPADRFRTADEFAAALDAVGKGDDAETVDPVRESARRPAVIATAVVIILVAAWLLVPRLMTPDGGNSRAPAGRDMSRSIAVLPFENISGSEEDSYFVDGVHAEILTRLAKIGGIVPISRASVLAYREAPKPPEEVAEELGVAVVLEGSVQRTGDRIRFNVQLTDGTGQVVWAEPYDRELSADNLFDIQSDIAQQITRALGAELSPAELRRIDRIPTDNLEAYDYWVLAYHYLNVEWKPEVAVEFLERALGLDEQFAEAHSSLGVAHTSLFWQSGRVDEEHCVAAREELDTARRLDPELVDVYVDTGWYYYRCFLDYDRALIELAEAQRLAPNSVEALEVAGAILRRQGNIDRSVEAHLRASELSPRYGDLHWHLMSSYALLRMPAEAEYHAERAISLVPIQALYYDEVAWVYLRMYGSPDRAREVLERGRALGIESIRTVAWDVWLDILVNHPDSALAKARAIPADEVIGKFVWHFPIRNRFQFTAAAYRLLGDRETEVAYLDSARVLLEAKLQESDAAFLHSALGVVYADLGLKADATREGEEAVRLLSVERDAWDGTYVLEDLARIYVITDEHEAALDVLERLMSIPSDLTPAYLEMDPTWDPLGEHPRFRALLEAGE